VSVNVCVDESVNDLCILIISVHHQSVCVCVCVISPMLMKDAVIRSESFSRVSSKAAGGFAAFTHTHTHTHTPDTSLALCVSGTKPTHTRVSLSLTHTRSELQTETDSNYRVVGRFLLSSTNDLKRIFLFYSFKTVYSLLQLEDLINFHDFSRFRNNF